ncbi:hypothetical protein [Rhodococcus erythropolis]|uniref:hypothetical protein n=1 Tax=Rhodococcus erythropolis TaxID=1833 RepID=UPI0036732A61
MHSLIHLFHRTSTLQARGTLDDQDGITDPHTLRRKPLYTGVRFTASETRTRVRVARAKFRHQQ